MLGAGLATALVRALMITKRPSWPPPADAVTPAGAQAATEAFAAFGAEDVRRKQDGRVPMVLWAIGPARLDDIADRAAAIVVTRAATAYGEHMAAALAEGLVEPDGAVG